MEQPTTLEFPRPTRLDRWPDKFEKQAILNPFRTAVISGTDSMTYGELSLRSSQIAAVLRSRGIGRGDFVGLGLHRSLGLPAALLGILKSGAAYVPLDPDSPAERITRMIHSAELKHVVTSSQLAKRFPEVGTICIDDGTPSDPCGTDAGLLDPHDNPIHAIFTSSSSLKPNPASDDPGGFGNLLRWYSIELEQGPGDRTLIISSPSFDLTQKNFFTPLITGGTLILTEGPNHDIPQISALIRDLGVTLINCPPSAFYPLVDAAAADSYRALSSLRFAVLGGEPVSIRRLRDWREHPNCHAEVVNSFGPTECTDICAYHRLHRGNLDDHPFVPFGREIPSVQTGLADTTPEPVPESKTGHPDDAARTARVFTGSGYRSGDLAKRHPSGLLEFNTGTSQAMKIDGLRIDPVEIEIALGHHPKIRQVIVTTDSDRLTAYILGTADTTRLHQFLSSRLPSHMIPDQFYVMDNFPLAADGKVDRQALASAVKPGVAVNRATSTLEAGILALWSEILDRPVTDPTANFFDLGGNSIHLAILHIRLLEMTGRRFPIIELFALPNARSIADFLSPCGVDAAAIPTSQRPNRARVAS